MLYNTFFLLTKIQIVKIHIMWLEKEAIFNFYYATRHGPCSPFIDDYSLTLLTVSYLSDQWFCHGLVYKHHYISLIKVNLPKRRCTA